MISIWVYVKPGYNEFGMRLQLFPKMWIIKQGVPDILKPISDNLKMAEAFIPRPLDNVIQFQPIDPLIKKKTDNKMIKQK